MLSEIIHASGQTQAAWAARIGVSAAYLSALLAGQKIPSLTLAARIEAITEGRVRAASWVRLPDTPRDAA